MLLEVSSFALGLIVGSFLNVVIHRVPRGTFFSGGNRSHCPACGAAIAWFDNLPVVSWLLLLRGKARCCDARISFRYPCVELITGLAFLWISWGRADLLFPARTIDWTQVGLLAVDFYFVATLLAASAIDLEHRILPDVLNFLGIGVGLLTALVLPELHGGCWLQGQVQGISPTGVAFINAVLGCAVGAGLLYGIGVVGKLVYKTEAMGLGDVKFMAFTGTFIGPEGVLIAMLIACIAGAAIGLIATLKTGDPLIPFGPFLAIGVLVAHFAGTRAATLLFEEWPRWLQTSRFGLLTLLIASVGSLGVLLFLRRRRRRLADGDPGADDASREE